jgi:hypothetical protein
MATNSPIIDEALIDEFADFPFPEAARQQQTIVDFNGNVFVGNTIQIAEHIGMQLGLPGFGPPSVVPTADLPHFGPPHPDASFFEMVEEVCRREERFPEDPIKLSLYTMERPPTPLYPISQPTSPEPVVRTECFVKPSKKAGAKPVTIEHRKKKRARKSGGGYIDWPFIDGVPRAHKFRNIPPTVAEPKDDGELRVQPNKTILKLPKCSISSGLEASYESP